jgi:hypothetical protein
MDWPLLGVLPSFIIGGLHNFNDQITAVLAAYECNFMVQGPLASDQYKETVIRCTLSTAIHLEPLSDHILTVVQDLSYRLEPLLIIPLSKAV